MTVEEQADLGHKIVDLIYREATGEPNLEIMHVLTGVAATMAGSVIEVYNDRTTAVRMFTMMLLAFQKELGMSWADLLKLVNLMQELDPNNPQRN